MTPHERHATVKARNGCFNCMGGGHSRKDCPAKGTCRTCQGSHNTLLHFEGTQPGKGAAKKIHVGSAYHSQTGSLTVALLGTAAIVCLDKDGRDITGRALIDTGSMLNMVTSAFATKLKYPLTPSEAKINTVGDQEAQSSQGTINFNIRTNDNNQIPVHATVLPAVTGKLPVARLDVKKLAEIEGKKLADPKFHEPGDIDMILGVEMFNSLMLDERVKCGKIVLSDTRVGWMVSGVADLAIPGNSVHSAINPFNRGSDGVHTAIDRSHVSSCIESNLTDSDISQWWKVHDMPGNNLLAKPESDYTPEEKFAADHYTNTTERTKEGSFIVQLPKKPIELTKGVQQMLGNSAPRAMRSQLSMEKTFKKDDSVFFDYNGFMNGYIESRHLVKVDIDLSKVPDHMKYYLPHHAVLKESTTTPFRVVVNGSAKTSSGLSLNDTLAVGPTLQPQLVVTLIAFRLRVFVFTGDISKMYRQVLLSAADRKFHLMFWRNDPSKPMEVYEMHRVSYGVASSCYHAIRTLQEIAKSSKDISEEVRMAILNDFYVDDLMTGSATKEEAKELLDGIIKVLGDAGMPIRKFASNDADLVTNLPAEFTRKRGGFRRRIT